MTRTAHTAIRLALAVFAVHATSYVSTSGDSGWTVPQTLSLIHERNFNLDEYAALFPAHNYYFVECVTPSHQWIWPIKTTTCPGHYYYLYPPGVAVAAVPVVAAIQAAAFVLHPLIYRFTAGSKNVWLATLDGDLVTGANAVEIIVSSVFIAIATAALFLAILEFVPMREAVVLALIFAFCTPAWSTASRSLASHAPSMMLNSLSILLLCRSAKRPGHLWMIGPLAALAFFVRPPDLIPAAVIGVYLLLNAPRRQWILAVLAGLPVLAFFVGTNIHDYGTFIPPYFTAPRNGHSLLGLNSNYLEALAGNWISPNRGMFIFCPFLILLFLPAAWRTDMGPLFRKLRFYFLAIVVLWWLSVSGHIYWWAGWAYGPRYMCDLFPFLIVLMAPLVHSVFERKPGIRFDRIALAVTLAIALFIHARGAYSISVHAWNGPDRDVDFVPSRVWDWSDLQFMRGL